HVLGTLTVTSGTFDGSGSSLTTGGDLNITSGATGFTAPSSTLTLAGDFNDPTNLFADNNGSVVLNGGTQAINNTCTIPNLSRTTAGTLIFAATSTVTVENNLTLTGTSGNPLYLRSDNSPTQWNIVPGSGTTTVSHVDVQDSNAAPSITPTFSHDSGNNTGWNF